SRVAFKSRPRKRHSIPCESVEGRRCIPSALVFFARSIRVHAADHAVHSATDAGTIRVIPRHHDGAHMKSSAGDRFSSALAQESPLQVVGTINAYSALLAKRAGFKSIYLSGAGVANASFGLPDLGITTLGDVCEDVRRICGACDLPLLVDARSEERRVGKEGRT